MLGTVLAMGQVLGPLSEFQQDNMAHFYPTRTKDIWHRQYLACVIILIMYTIGMISTSLDTYSACVLPNPLYWVWFQFYFLLKLSMILPIFRNLHQHSAVFLVPSFYKVTDGMLHYVLCISLRDTLGPFTKHIISYRKFPFIEFSALLKSRRGKNNVWHNTLV